MSEENQKQVRKFYKKKRYIIPSGLILFFVAIGIWAQKEINTLIDECNAGSIESCKELEDTYPSSYDDKVKRSKITNPYFTDKFKKLDEIQDSAEIEQAKEKAKNERKTDEVNTNKNTQVNENKSTLNNVVRSKWVYFDYEDKASGKTAYQAYVESENKINLSFPYSGFQNGRLSVRNHPRFGKEIFFQIDKGQILSTDGYSYDNKYFLVRFDDGDVKKWNYGEAADQSTEVIFIQDKKAFLEKLTNSKKVYLTVNLYQDGQYTFIFNSTGLKEEFR